MGIFNAMITAVAGLQAQSFALENISGNIANSQTVGFKRNDTSFADLVASDGQAATQVSGSVRSMSTSTNGVQGGIQSSDISTNMSINGDGYFVVGAKTGTSDGSPTFGDTSLYTRRGDFTMDKDGYLENGTGYYLKAIPVDPTTGNPLSGTPTEIQFSNDFLPAKTTQNITYHANLAAFPLTANADTSIPGSELMPASTLTGPLGNVTGANSDQFINNSVNGGAVTVYDTSGSPVNVQMRWAKTSDAGTAPADAAAGTAYTGLTAGQTYSFQVNGQTVNLDATTGGTATSAAASIQSQLDTSFGTGKFTVTADSSGKLDIKGASDGSNSVAITNVASTGGGTAAGLGFGTGLTANPTPTTNTWNLFYLTNSNATGSTTAWVNAGTNYVFNASGQMTPAITSTTLSGLSVNGDTVGNVTLQFDKSGLTQYADTNGVAQVNTLTQDGYAAGQATGVSISDGGAIVASYSNGETMKVGQVLLASFSGQDDLQKQDGGAFAATIDSGQPILGATGKISGSSTEASNTDIATEFSKLIVTQQAYSANTRIVTTSNQMMQDVMDMVR